ncbi:hypothetical protein PtrM4_039410 [Pyrenophora tritici-repentis]|uniref:Uncharacterized protein n=1 Tax=Pyrenophora tritici-repentis TaxID=45151 RepID=A0A834RIV1_9PLEO|nr:hypothetical protein PtrM4_039410 [Pyrenophora tritici-repentis]
MARERTKADSGAKYSLYFKLLHQKIEEYNVQPIHIFNMDEKGFQLGRVGRTNRVFNKKLYESKGLARYLQDSQGLLNLTKGDFFPLFWRAWCNVFKPLLIKRSFEATSIYPANPDVVLEKFANILREEVRGLRQSLAIKERRSKQFFTLQLNEDEVYHGGAKLWSPRSVQRARDRRASQQQQQELKKLQKAEQAEIKKAARDCELQFKAVKRVKREKG